MRTHTGDTLRLPRAVTPLWRGGVTEEEVQGVRLSKELRQRAEGLEAQREGGSLKGISYGAHYKGTSSKVLPTAPQTNTYICHTSRQMYT